LTVQHLLLPHDKARFQGFNYAFAERADNVTQPVSDFLTGTDFKANSQ